MISTEDHPREGGRRSRSADELAGERVVRILDHIARQGVPIRASDGRRPERELERARIRAEQLADDAGRGEMLDEAREVVTEAYTARLGDAGLWAYLIATSVPYSPRDRADSQAALLDLVTAAVTEDLLEASAVRLLRDDGQRLLDLPTLVSDVRSGIGAAPGAVADAYRRDDPTTRRVLHLIGTIALAALIFLIVAGATEDLVIALLVASVVVVLLLLSVYGPGWWERRGRAR